MGSGEYSRSGFRRPLQLKVQGLGFGGWGLGYRSFGF